MSVVDTNKTTNSVAFSPQANYTDWSTATCWWNLVPTFVDRGVSRGKRGGSPTVVNLSFLDRCSWYSVAKYNDNIKAKAETAYDNYTSLYFVPVQSCYNYKAPSHNTVDTCKKRLAPTVPQPTKLATTFIRTWNREWKWEGRDGCH
jgi:hypothetical protein